LLLLRDTRIDARAKEGVNIVHSEAATERAAGRIKVRVWEELNRQAASLKDHPGIISPAFRKPELGVEGRRLLRDN
jgi:hypothetical protein